MLTCYGNQFNLKRFHDAKKEFEKAITLNDKYARPHANLAFIFYLQENKDKAHYHLERAKILGLNDPSFVRLEKEIFLLK